NCGIDHSARMLERSVPHKAATRRSRMRVHAPRGGIFAARPAPPAVEITVTDVIEFRGVVGANVMTEAPVADPDSDVLGLVANGDMKGALRRLMQRHGTSVYRYCREALRDRALAEDVQQQVFVSAFRDLPKFSGRSTVRTWLFAIARHRVLDAAKSRRR